MGSSIVSSGSPIHRLPYGWSEIPEIRSGWGNKRSVGETSRRPSAFLRPRPMMQDEKKSREKWQDIQADGSRDGNSDPLQETKDNAGSDTAVVTDGEDRVNFFIWLLVACSSISGLLFGASSIQFIPAFRLRSLRRSHTMGCRCERRLRHR